MDVFRILKEPYWHDPLSVAGAEMAGGRWNPPGVGILYTASSPALALLETMVHLPGIPYDRLPHLRLFTLRIPDDIRWIYPDVLPAQWSSPAALPFTQYLFSEWLETPADLALGVPSAILANSFNYLLHPGHLLYKGIEIISHEDIMLDHRLWRGSSDAV